MAGISVSEARSRARQTLMVREVELDTLCYLDSLANAGDWLNSLAAAYVATQKHMQYADAVHEADWGGQDIPLDIDILKYKMGQ